MNIFSKIPAIKNPENIDTDIIENEIVESCAYYDYVPFQELMVQMAYHNFPTFYTDIEGYIDWEW